MSTLPLVYNPFDDEIILRSIDLFENLPWNWREEEERINRAKDKYEVKLQVRGFQPGDISVKTIDGDVVIECKHEERKDDQGYISRRFTRRYALPEDCSPADVLSTLSSDGILTVIAPRKPRIRNDTVIPVTNEVSNPRSKL